MKDSKASLLILLCIYLSHNIIVIHGIMLRNVYIAYLGDRPHDDHHRIVESHYDLLASVVGSKEEAAKLMVHNYKYGFSGFSSKLTKSQARKLAANPDVIHLIPDRALKPQGTRAPDYLGLSTQLPHNILQKTNKGEDIIIGVVDTGIWANNSKAFSDEGYGPIPSRWKGKCESSGDFDASQHCNKKVIGAYWHRKGATASGFDPKDVVKDDDTSPLDSNGHGTHCASTAAGSEVSNVTYKGHEFGTFRGTAPRARLAIYKACFNVNPKAHDVCCFSDIVEAFDQAIHDGVDVISASIGGIGDHGSDMDNNPNFASYHAAVNGIVVVAAAGNKGPRPKTMGNTSPWLITVAATNMDDGIAVPITLGNNITLMGEPTMGMEEIGRKKLVSFDNSIFVKGKTFPFDNKALVEKLKGNVGFFHEFSKLSGGKKDTIDNLYYSVTKLGGVGIIVDVSPSNAITYSFRRKKTGPIILVRQDVSRQILAYTRQCNNDCTVHLAEPRYVPDQQNIRPAVADFSSRGPSSNTPVIIKPDIATPGVDIIAVASTKNHMKEVVDNGWMMLTGTSMATPLFAGLVALLKSVHPHWSPAAIKSAFVTTGINTDVHGAPISDPSAKSGIAGPLEIGGGIANVTSAQDPGLVYDMQPSDYFNYLCGVGYSINEIKRITRDQSAICPSEQQSLMNVNLPSIGISGLQYSLKIQRTVSNVGPAGSVYTAQINSPPGTKITVIPNVLKFDEHVHQITFDINIMKIGSVEANAVGSLTWSDGVHNVRSPIVILS